MVDILIIDDDPVIRCVVAAVLTRAGHHVREAADGVDGIAAFKRQHPALVITDIIMPDREGIEVIREVRREVPKLPILAMSGGTPRGVFYLHAATVLGADATLLKPFRPAELLTVVADLLSHAPAAQAG